MKIYQGTLHYTLLREGDEDPLDSPERVVEFMDGALSDPTVETFWVIPVGTKNHPCGRFCVGSGTATACLVHPREVFKPAILASATAVIVVHNHPSGDPSPSSADIRVTRTLREAAEHLQMQLLDHVIIGQPSSRHSGFYSFREAGMI